MDCPQQSESLAHIHNAANLVKAGAYYTKMNPEKSFGYFKNALDLLHSATKDEEFGSDYASPGLSPHKSRLTTMFSAQAAVPHESDPAACASAVSEIDGSYFVYCKPFFFSQETLDIALTPLYISIVIFDMALLLHKAGLQRSERNLLKSLKLYDMSLMLLRTAPQYLDCSNVMLAVLNNKTHVCFALRRFQEGQSSMEEFSELLTSVLGEGISSVFDEPELNDMILNTLLPPGASTIAPAA